MHQTILRTLRKASITLGAAAALALAGMPAAHAQGAAANYPAKPIRILVGYAAGGSTDIAARIVGQKLQEALGQPVIIDNRPGASSNIASDAAARAAPDGYTLLFGTIANATNMSVYKNLNYDTLRSFVPITQVMAAPSVLVATPGLGVKSLKDLLQMAKADPKKISFASTGVGGTPHLAGEMLKQRAGIEMLHVLYKGASPAITDLVSGTVSVGFMTALAVLPHLQSGRLTPLAVTSNKRLAQLPNVPTMAEAGIADFEVSSWNGLLAPAGTPPEILAKLNRETVKILAMPDVRAKFEEHAAEAVGGSPENFHGYIKSEIGRWSAVVRASGSLLE